MNQDGVDDISSRFVFGLGVELGENKLWRYIWSNISNLLSVGRKSDRIFWEGGGIKVIRGDCVGAGSITDVWTSFYPVCFDKVLFKQTPGNHGVWEP